MAAQWRMSHRPKLHNCLPMVDLLLSVSGTAAATHVGPRHLRNKCSYVLHARESGPASSTMSTSNLVQHDERSHAASSEAPLASCSSA